MHFLRTILTVLLIAVLYPALSAEETITCWSAPANTSDYSTKVGTLQSSDGYTFTGSISIGAQCNFAIKYNDNTYLPMGQASGWEESVIGKKFTFYQNSNWGYMWMHFGGTYAIKATLSADKSEISVAFVEPTPLTMTIGGSTTTLSSNIDSYTGTIEYTKIINVRTSPVSIGAFTTGGVSYGATAAVQFTDDTAPQSQVCELTPGGREITLDKKGNYSISVSIVNGIPVKVSITKAEMVPDLTVNGSILSYADGLYTGTLTLTKGSSLAIRYNDSQSYFLQSDIDGSLETPSGKVSLSTSDRNAKVLARGSYSITIDMNTLTLSYINNTPPQPSTLSPTLPAGLVDCESPSSYTPDEPMTLWYNTAEGDTRVGNYEATNLEVFLLGNGRMGMTLLGKATEEMPIHDKTNYDAVTDTDYSSPGSVGNYNTIANIKATNKALSYDSSILRQLDLTTAVASAITRDGEKIYAREYLVSNHNRAGAIHYTCDGGAKLSYTFGISLGGSASADGTVSVTSGNTTNCAIRYNVTLKVTQNGGTLSTDGANVSVTDADEITLYYTVSTNYDIDSADECYSGESDDQLAARSLTTVNNAAALGWQAVYDDHIAEYSPLFNSVKFSLADAANNVPTKALKAHYDNVSFNDYYVNSDEQTRAVDMLLFGMGRYLNLASSRGELALPNNLQGIWADSNPQWGCDFHANINLQMNYWAAENTNIPEAHMPFLNYLNKMAAKRWTNYADRLVPGTGGWTTHLLMNTFGTSGTYNGYYTEAAAWNCSHIWQHYLYTQDKEFLAKFFDTMYGACLFYFGYLKDTDGDGQLEIPNYYSPELNNGSSVAVHAQQTVYQHLCNTRDAAIILGKTAEAEKCTEYIDRMYTGIDIRDGEQCEWKGALTSEATHRHLSHLMCLYPFAQVSPYDADRTAYEGAFRALLTRADEDGGENAAWNTAWKMNCYARALEGDLAMRQLAYGMKERITADMRTTCKRTFQIEGGAGISAAIAEMLLQSYSGVIDLLPALPVSSWNGGEVSGLKAVGNYEVAISWENGEISEASVADCLNSTMRDGTCIRVHASTLPGGDITKLQINGVNVTEKEDDVMYARSSTNGPTYVHEYNTDSYLVSIPAGSNRTARISFGDVSTGIEDISINNASAPIELYDLSGRRVVNPTHGIYIRRQGSQVSKIQL